MKKPTVLLILLLLVLCACQLSDETRAEIAKLISEVVTAQMGTAIADLVAAGKITPVQSQAILEALTGLGTQIQASVAKGLAGATQSADVDQWLTIGGTVVGALLGNTALSRFRRNVGVLTGRPRTSAESPPDARKT